MNYWKTKTFYTYEEALEWLETIEHNHEAHIIYINNGYGVEYRKLIQL